MDANVEMNSVILVSFSQYIDNLVTSMSSLPVNSTNKRESNVCRKGWNQFYMGLNLMH